jgi:hypothetical protein
MARVYLRPRLKEKYSTMTSLVLSRFMTPKTCRISVINGRLTSTHHQKSNLQNSKSVSKILEFLNSVLTILYAMLTLTKKSANDALWCTKSWPPELPLFLELLTLVKEKSSHSISKNTLKAKSPLCKHIKKLITSVGASSHQPEISLMVKSQKLLLMECWENF